MFFKPIIVACCLIVPAWSAAVESIEALGERLFSDVNLSFNRTQSCATCHAPAAGFADLPGSGVAAAASLGDNGTAYGATTEAIPAVENTDLFAPFDSKYDRSLRGEYQMTM